MSRNINIINKSAWHINSLVPLCGLESSVPNAFHTSLPVGLRDG